MFEVIVIFIGGIAAGVVFKNRAALIRGAEKITTLSIYLLLFLLGGLVGINDQVISSFGSLGLKAAVLSFGAILGSGITLLLIDRMMFRKGRRE